MSTPIKLNLYGPDDEVLKTCVRAFIPWKMLKRAVTLNKQLGKKEPDAYEETDIDAITSYVIEFFDGQNLTIEMLDEQADIAEMITVIRAVVSRARGIMDPTLPPKG